MNLKQGDKVVYGTHGACTITFIGKIEMNPQNDEYMVLEPCDQPESKYYVPTHNPIAMSRIRKIMTKEQLEDLLSNSKIIEEDWICADMRRKEHYKNILNNGDFKEIIGMIQSLYSHRQQQSSVGRKFHVCDENLLKSAEQMIASEVSQILSIPQYSVEEYIKSKLDE